VCVKKARVPTDTEKDSTFLEVMKNSSTNCHAMLNIKCSLLDPTIHIVYSKPPNASQLSSPKSERTTFSGSHSMRPAVINKIVSEGSREILGWESKKR
jgi:hypothetical protein